MLKAFNCVTAAAFAFAASCATAQSYPSKPIRLISPFAPGGGADITCRAIAQKLGPALGQQVIVDNRGGAGGLVGVELAAKSPPDGYTIVLGTIGNIAVAPSMYSKMPYDPQKDLVPIGQVANTLNILVVHPSLPAKTIPEFIAVAKKNPGKLLFGSSGAGAADHLAGELFNIMAGVKMIHIPYKGGAPAMLDLVSGQVQLVFATVATALGSIEAHRIRPIAMAGTQRYERLPSIPTISEAGLKGFEANNWYGLFAPAGTPREAVSRIQVETAKALSQADVKTRLLDTGIIATSTTPDAFSAYIQRETIKWAKVVKAAHIKPD